jgi:hypothetical protein
MEDHVVVAILPLVLVHHPECMTELVSQGADIVQGRVQELAPALPTQLRVRRPLGLLPEADVVVLEVAANETDVRLLLERLDRRLDRDDVSEIRINLFVGPAFWYCGSLPNPQPSSRHSAMRPTSTSGTAARPVRNREARTPEPQLA